MVFRESFPAHPKRLVFALWMYGHADVDSSNIAGRKDVIRSAWQQKGALIREVFKKNRKPTRMTAPENMLNGPSKLRTASRPFDRSPTLNSGQILESAPFVRSPVEEGDFGDLTRVPTTESFESGLGEREKPGKLGKLVHKIKARTTNRQQHGDDR